MLARFLITHIYIQPSFLLEKGESRKPLSALSGNDMAEKNAVKTKSGGKGFKRNGHYLSEIDGRLDKGKFEKEFNAMIEYIKKKSGNKKIIAVGNPPYQENYKGDGSNTGANPIYHVFLNSLIESKVVDEFIMVIPSRWFAGGRGKSLKDFALRLRNSQQIRQICDFENSKEVFSNVEIKGGVCFLHWDSSYKGKALFFNKKKNEKELIDLSFGSIIVRNKTSRTIMEKVYKKSNDFISDTAWSWNPFDLPSNYFDKNPESQDGDLLECFTKRRIVKKIKKSKIEKNKDKISYYKVACPKAVSSGGIPYRKDQIFIMGKNQICTETYMVIDSFASIDEAKKFLSYLQTDFSRYLLSIKKITQDITKETWSLVPNMERSKTWTDHMLYDFFDFDETEINHIKAKVKEWS